MDIWANLPTMVVCYLYILALIFISGKITRNSSQLRRKFLHAMIGNLPLLMPFFTERLFPFLVACPFIVVTLLVSPFSPWQTLTSRLKGLNEITLEGNNIGLILYAISYSLLALLFGLRPYVVAAGILPMAYGDSLAAILGISYGKHKLRFSHGKSVEGCIGMFLGSLFSLLVGIYYFSRFYTFSFASQFTPIIGVALASTMIEVVSPKGTDNLTVPLLGSIIFILLGGGA